MKRTGTEQLKYAVKVNNLIFRNTSFINCSTFLEINIFCLLTFTSKRSSRRFYKEHICFVLKPIWNLINGHTVYTAPHHIVFSLHTNKVIELFLKLEINTTGAIPQYRNEINGSDVWIEIWVHLVENRWFVEFSLRHKPATSKPGILKPFGCTLGWIIVSRNN